MKPFVRRPSGAFTLSETLVIAVVLALVVAFVLPALLPARRRSSRVGCINNIKQVGLAFRIWSGDNGDRFPMQVSITNGGTMEVVPKSTVFPHFQVMSNELNTPRILVCPRDSKRTGAWSFATNLSDSQISYFVGVDAEPTRTNMLLVGDRNVALNGRAVPHGLVSLATNSPVGWTKETHVNHGNVAMVDGSVAWNQNGSQLGDHLRRSGATNRLAIP
jgi:prepilin-type processing-associated H-X9-DG protein